MSSPSSSLRAPAGQVTLYSADSSIGAIPKYASHVARAIKKAFAPLTKVLTGNAGGNSRGDSELGDDRQAEVIKRYITPAWHAANPAFEASVACAAPGAFCAPETPSLGILGDWLERQAMEYSEAHEHAKSAVSAAVSAEVEAHEPDPCCVGEDVPGVGLRHSAKCPVSPSGVCRCSGTGEVPPSLRRLLHEELWGQLLFAARDLAWSLITAEPWTREIALGHREPRRFCRECFVTEEAGAITHKPICRAGRVSGLIQEILDECVEPNSKRKELAFSEEVLNGHAAAGTPPRGELNEPWEVREDTYGDQRVFDAIGRCLFYMAASATIDPRPILERAVDCVNSMSGISTSAAVRGESMAAGLDGEVAYNRAANGGQR